MSESTLGGLFGGAALGGLNLNTAPAAPEHEETDETIHEVVIVGAGPAGNTAAIYAARADLHPVLFASSVAIGGALMNTTEVENFPGFVEGIQGPELMSNIAAQAERFGTDVRYADVTRLELEGDVKKIHTSDGKIHLSKTVILSTGSQYRSLDVPGEERLSGHGVSWCATCDGFFFKDKVLAVVGGGDSALEEANFLTKYASKVYLIHRRDSFRASDIMQKRVFENEKIEVIWNSQVVEIQGESTVNNLVLEDTATGQNRDLAVDGIFEAIGSDPRIELVADQLELTENNTIAVQGRSSRTSLPGVFACGDVIDPTYRQAIIAAGSGAVAALDAQHYLESL
ncbi:MAG: thioredoxin-disulfide reductase [Rothia sp. (in: high G+C Gram-positive bacteria)]|uniref:thioredoxin-disulfide reductase n=1 Tax=Rothia sp. (in: high G+C Gram-positive bacteria) TaxID=1885016 RepID=UPI0026DED95E|nr:thioredoxin-disulfide reductase [Rothia sp. (in: high G+C Gram-positive bacteria)]MDO5749589.1 thioredoxin-disulfide reductase [Rothia sp. (in: high G+C Gram-positive bacteria)]